nr:glycoside hydrolase 43 family protein [Kineococcus siccus]
MDGDYSDPDVVLVDGTYWMVTSTIHGSPGMAVLRSPDLLAWEHVGHVVADLTELGPAYAHAATGSRFGRGVYAGSIRHHDGRFWVHFTTLDEGVFVCTAVDPAGPWSPPHRLSDATMWDDPCPLWDDDGRAWLVLSNPGPEWFTHLVPMSPDGRTLHLDQRRVVDDRHTSEGNKLFRRGPWYYLLHNEVRSHGDRLAVVLRTRSLDAPTPWEKRDLVHGAGLDRSREPNQGSLLADVAGDWWFVTHHGRTGYPEGRPLSRVPVTWEDDWPVVRGPDGPTDRAVLDERVVVGTVGPRDDDFDRGRPGPQWEWAVVPAPGSWSVLADPPCLQLVAGPSARGDGLRTAPAVLTQRIAARPGRATVLLDGSGLAEGGVAGLGHYAVDGPVGFGLARQDGRLWLVLVGEGTERLAPAPGDRLELCTEVDAHHRAVFAVRAEEAAEFTPLGDSHPLRFSHYRGSRLALFALADGPAGGSARFSRFRYGLLDEPHRLPRSGTRTERTAP